MQDQPERTPEQIREHYQVEKKLANRLRKSTRQERKTLYTTLYDELFRRVPHHPQLVKKATPEETAQEVAYHLRHLKSFLTPDTVFLEVGPGDCALALAVSKAVKTVYAVDVSEEITKNIQTPENFTLVLSDGTSIPVPDHGVDVAYSYQLMEHLHPEDALDQLANIYRALAPGGIYLCITPNRLNGPHDVSRHFDPVATGFHLQEYTVAELDRLFQDTGFSTRRILIPLKSLRLFLPVGLIKLMENTVRAFPPFLQKRFASSWLGTKLFGVRMLGIK